MEQAGLRQRGRQAERGSVLLMTAIMLLFIIGMVALAIDLGYLLSVRGQLQNGLDASALAGAAGLRAVIEEQGVTEEQDRVVRQLARRFASFNSVRRSDAVTGLTVADSDVTVAHYSQPPQVTVKHRLPGVPTIFANVFGIAAMDISGGAVGTLTPVDGGTGLISGCWRPILMPDTFFDVTGNVWAIGGTYDPWNLGFSASRTSNPQATQPGDYYRSRFAGGIFGGFPFVDSTTGVPPCATISAPCTTSIRDAIWNAQLKHLGGDNLIGMPMLFDSPHYRIIDFNHGDLADQTRNGFCAQVQVGQQVSVFPKDDTASYLTVNQELRELIARFNDPVDNTTLRNYHYVKSDRYQTPNTNPRIIPVLFCDPVEFSRHPDSTEFVITNFGAFHLEFAPGDGRLYGYFVRELVIGGVPIRNDVADRSLLPVRVQLRQ